MEDTVADLNPATHEQVAKLLGASRAAEMLGMLRETLVRLSSMPEGELAESVGLALVHRLKSEAGLMGFDRLSNACEAVDTARIGGNVGQNVLTNLQEAIASARRIIDMRGQ